MTAGTTQRLRIGYFGDGPWANRALARIVDDGRFEVAFITPRHSDPDAGLRSWANRLGVPFLTAADVNNSGFIAEIARFSCDVLVSMSFDQILRRAILQVPGRGFINCHAGALPFYRGRNPLNWALVNGETRFGVTVHYIDESIDTGDVIVQNFSPIAPTDTYADLLARAHGLCADALLEALIKIHDGTAAAVPQHRLDSSSSYYSRRRPGDEWINWAWPSQRIHNLVRAITLPGPCARSLHADHVVAIVETEPVDWAEPHLGSDGEIVGRDDRGVLVKTGDTLLRITQIAAVRADDTLDVVATPRFPLGTRLGLNILDEVIALRRRMRACERQLNDAAPAKDVKR